MALTAQPLTKYEFNADRVEFLVCNRAQSAALTRESFARVAAGQLKQKLQELVDAAKEKKPSPFPSPISDAFSIHFTEGGVVHILLLDSGAPNFEIQTAIRNAFQDKIKLEKKQNLRIIGFDSVKTKVILSFALSLAKLAEWKPTAFGFKKTEITPAKKNQLSIFSDVDFSEAEINRALKLAENTSLVRRLADLPGNELNPRNYRALVQKHAAEHKLKFEFYDFAALKKKGAGAFLAVAQGDPTRSSGIARLSYRAAKGKTPLKKLVLVGKGLCFDTGGYNIKTGAYMYGMEKDMTGSAIALALITLLAQLNVPLEVEAYLAITENLISAEAFRPNDVVTALDGTSIEVIDTDAEGRMVLADTLALARKHGADLTLDFATLTGASIRAIDTFRSTVFSNRPHLLRAAEDAGIRAGERVWGFPIGDEYWEALKSDVADLRQLAAHNNSDHIYAATFLSHFIGAECPWVHLDLAAANHKGGLGLVASDTTGFGVRWALDFIEAQLLA